MSVRDARGPSSRRARSPRWDCRPCLRTRADAGSARQVLQHRRQADDVQPRRHGLRGRDRRARPHRGRGLHPDRPRPTCRSHGSCPTASRTRASVATGASRPTSAAPTTAFDVAIHPDGGIVVAGERDTAAGSKAAVVRYLPRGKRNKDFGGGDGIVLTSFGKKYQGANAVVIGRQRQHHDRWLHVQRVDREVGAGAIRTARRAWTSASVATARSPWTCRRPTSASTTW